MAVSTFSLQGRPLSISPQDRIGWGGEAEVFLGPAETVFKIYRSPGHPDLKGDSRERRSAEERLREVQAKLPAFPSDLPAPVVSPQELVYQFGTPSVAGFQMERVDGVSFAQLCLSKEARQGRGFESLGLLGLAQTLDRLHRRGVVVGDFKDSNLVLDRSGMARLLDADSFQFQGFPCRVFTPQYTDPQILDPQDPQRVRQGFTPQTDWFAFHVLLFRLLFWISPYGGIWKGIAPSRRSIEGLSVLHPGVKVPAFVPPFEILPDPVLSHFQETFEGGRRRVPWDWLETLHFQSCPRCDLDHAVSSCPRCKPRKGRGVEAPEVQEPRRPVSSGRPRAGILVATRRNPPGFRVLAYENSHHGLYLLGQREGESSASILGPKGQGSVPDADLTKGHLLVGGRLAQRTPQTFALEGLPQDRWIQAESFGPTWLSARGSLIWLAEGQIHQLSPPRGGFSRTPRARGRVGPAAALYPAPDGFLVAERWGPATRVRRFWLQQEFPKEWVLKTPPEAWTRAQVLALESGIFVACQTQARDSGDRFAGLFPNSGGPPRSLPAAMLADLSPDPELFFELGGRLFHDGAAGLRRFDQPSGGDFQVHLFEGAKGSPGGLPRTRAQGGRLFRKLGPDLFELHFHLEAPNAASRRNGGPA